MRKLITNNPKINANHQLIQVIALAIAYIAITIFITVHLLHDSYQTSALDLGMFTQDLKFTLNGQILYNTVGNLSHLAYHFSPVLLLMVPIYWLFPHAQTLLVIQAVLLGASGCLIYWLARVYKLNHHTSLFIELLFFLNPLLWGTALFDFHEVVFAIPAMLALFIGIQTKRNWLIVIGLLVALTSKEDVILTIAIWAIGMIIYYFWKERKIIKIYMIIFLAAIFAYGIAIGTSALTSNGEFPRILTYSTVRFQYLKLPLGDAIRGVVQTFFSSGSLYLFLAYLAPLGYLPLASIQWCFPGLVVLLENVLSTCPNQHNQLLQSQAPAIPFLFISFITSIAWIKDNERFKAILAKIKWRFPIYFGIVMVSVSLCYLTSTRLSLARLPDAHDYAIDQVLKLIPNDVTVTVNNTLFPHICNRTITYLANWEDPYSPIENGAWGFPEKDTQYIVIDSVYLQLYAGGPGYWENMFTTELNDKYHLVASIDGCNLYQLNP